LAHLLRMANRGLAAWMKLRGFRSVHAETRHGRVHALVLDGGGAHDLVMLHGISSAGAHFVEVARALRPFFRRIWLPDLPGHGLSDAPRAQEVRALGEALDAALREWLTEPAWFLGNSLGGLAAIRFAASHPDLVRGLFALSPAGARIDPASFRSFTQSLHVDDHAAAVDFVDRLFEERFAGRHLLAVGVRHCFREPTVARLVREARTDDLLNAREIASLGMPLWLVWGTAEKILSDDQLRWFQEHLPPQARTLRPAGFGHAPFLDRPGALAVLIRRFVEENA
jgi:pimeloyl-ACP methyl ester carboxylesterase